MDPSGDEGFSSIDIPFCEQDIRAADFEFVATVLKIDFQTQGSMVPKFEDALFGITGVKYGTAVISSPSALHTPCLVLMQCINYGVQTKSLG